MKENCLSKNPLVRDGTSQPGRVLNTLLPSYVSVDERSMKDLLDFVQQFSTEINFYKNNGDIDGDWQDFFQLTTDDWNAFSLEDYLEKLQSIQETKPHWALFFSFLYLFKIAQADLNTITKRHLDFYYRDVLQLKENPAVADQVTIIFKLAKHISDHLIKKGTLLKAGKDANGVELFCKVEKDVVINKSQVVELKSIFANVHNALPSKETPAPVLNHRIFAAPIANSADGLGGDLETEQKDWRTFGRPELVGITPDRSQGEIGFAIASPQLFLAEGTRKITLTFAGADFALTSNPFKIFFSGEEEWIEATSLITSSGNSNTAPLDRIEATVNPDQPAVVAYNKENLTEPFQTKFPVVKIVLINGNTFSYETLKEIKPQSVNINVEVDNVRQLILQNDQSVLDPGKPFQPFTNRPFLGSNFYIGSWEVFQKNISELKLNILWNERPGNFNTHYSFASDPTSTYQVYNNSVSQNSFSIDAFALEGKNWVAFDPGNLQPLFSDPLNIPNPTEIKRAVDLNSFKKFDVQSTKGFIRLTLRGSDFGHKEYPNAYAQQAMRIAKDPSLTTNALPDAPYTPSIQELSINYKSEETLFLDDQNAAKPAIQIDQFFHVEPFGVKEINTDKFENHLLPQYNTEGNLFLGIENLKPAQTLSLHFQVAEGSANPDRNKQELSWSYLKNNEWIVFEPKQILSNTTDDLLTSGIIQFDIPKGISNQNTLLPNNLHWIKMAVEKDSDAICRLIDIKAQALLAKFSNNNNDPDHLSESLPDGTISKLYRNDSSVDKINQPYHSFGGKLQENSTAFYTRVSERLRHKRRAITMWDYERLILQAFPEVYKVKSINHTQFTGTLTDYSELKPGHVTLIVISNVQNKNAVDPLRPKTSLTLLSEIDRFIKKICPPCIKLFVKNPLYESIKVAFKVKFRNGIDSGFFLKKLNEEIRFFLSPWASDCAKDIVFGGKIHKSMILNFVEERSYVDYVSCFEMFHIVPTDTNNKPNKNIEEASATTAVSILGSADLHDITAIPIETEGCACEDNEIKSTNRLLTLGDASC